jgi:dihydrofolate reductase (trimethoprim resistance protein)
MKISMIAAKAKNGVIGNGTAIPWKVKGEQQLFKNITMGKTLLVGYTTYSDMGALPGREILVVSRKRKSLPPGTPNSVRIFPSIQSAIYYAKTVAKVPELVIAGGASLYESCIEFVDDLYLTEIDIEPEGDAFFPLHKGMGFTEIISSEIITNERYCFTWYRRLKRPLCESRNKGEGQSTVTQDGPVHLDDPVRTPCPN